MPGTIISQVLATGVNLGKVTAASMTLVTVLKIYKTPEHPFYPCDPSNKGSELGPKQRAGFYTIYAPKRSR